MLYYRGINFVPSFLNKVNIVRVTVERQKKPDKKKIIKGFSFRLKNKSDSNTVHKLEVVLKLDNFYNISFNVFFLFKLI